MAHKFSVKITPHQNQNGSLSKTKKDYTVYDRSRGKKVLVGVATSQKGANELIEHTREMKHADHLAKHPNDTAFKTKHGIEN